MKDRYLYLLLSGLLVLSWNSQVWAQAAERNLPDPQAQIDRLRREIDELLKDAVVQPFPRPFSRSGTSWGGVRFAKVNPALQEQLGLPENEGLLISSVDADSSADKAGLKANDILVKINKKSVPSDPEAFATLLKEQKLDAGIDLVVVRDGKEEALKGAKMPAFADPGFDGKRNGRPGLPGLKGRPGMDGFGFPRIKINPGKNFPGGNVNRVTQSTVNGVTITRRETGEEFSGDYLNGDLRITVRGKFENGVAKPSEIVVHDGKESKKYTDVKEVPEPHRAILPRLLPTPALELRNLPLIPNRAFPGLPVIPGVDN